MPNCTIKGTIYFISRYFTFIVATNKPAPNVMQKAIIKNIGINKKRMGGIYLYPIIITSKIANETIASIKDVTTALVGKAKRGK
ncbi:hypothetical protein CPJCM30710_14120 [Clostridium polyendosporum]|uniref:Uncharacterized protein n=1 Tax=Clostridium polyendosporum TaxID=69208 RepID=A0A919RYL6_9CLOT|nr:hypothetical protein CPJCM30710_14120 [Clostridium polyendosporum]